MEKLIIAERKRAKLLEMVFQKKISLVEASIKRIKSLIEFYPFDKHSSNV